MFLAVILALFFLSLSPTSAGYPGPPLVTPSIGSVTESQAGGPIQAPPAQPTSTPGQSSSDRPKPTPKPHHRKKTSTANCSTGAPTPNSASKSAASTPCPPPKKVVRHGGAAEPEVQVTGGTTAEQTLNQRSTEQLKLATEQNLKKIETRQLTPAQQEMKNQIKQFMEQSNTAAADGDLDRAHSLALKANLLSAELGKP